IGDAIMAVFGLPRVHEDDALRAVRAAADMQRALLKLNEELTARWEGQLANRIGGNTREGVAGDPSARPRLATRRAINPARARRRRRGGGAGGVGGAGGGLRPRGGGAGGGGGAPPAADGEGEEPAGPRVPPAGGAGGGRQGGRGPPHPDRRAGAGVLAAAGG